MNSSIVPGVLHTYDSFCGCFLPLIVHDYKAQLLTSFIAAVKQTKLLLQGVLCHRQVNKSGTLKSSYRGQGGNYASKNCQKSDYCLS